MTGANNVLVLMSDEHTRSVMGAYGNQLVHTPALDKLANNAVADLHPGTRQFRNRHPGFRTSLLVIGGTLLWSAAELDAALAR